MAARSVGRPDVGEVALVPGLAVARYLWPTAESFAQLGLRAWLLRPPGWPGTPGRRSDQPVGMRALGVAVAHWLSRRGRPLVLVGQSVGTQIAVHAATQCPDAVRALVLQGPTVDPTYRSVRELVGGWMRDARQEPARLGMTQVPEWARVGPRHLARLLRACLVDDIEGSLADLSARVPVLVARGEHDRICRRRWADSLSTAPLADLPGGHASAASHPDEFARVVTAWAGLPEGQLR